jgi:hypothetical protein
MIIWKTRDSGKSDARKLGLGMLRVGSAVRIGGRYVPVENFQYTGRDVGL